MIFFVVIVSIKLFFSSPKSKPKKEVEYNVPINSILEEKEDLSQHLNNQFSISPPNVSNVDQEKISYTDLVYYMFLDQRIPILKRLELGNFLIWKSSNPDHINHVYHVLFEITHNKRYNRKIRMNAIDMLLRSNNTRYIDIAQQSLQKLRREELVYDENSLRQRINHINTRIHNLGEFPYTAEDIELQQVLLDQHRRLETHVENMTKRKSTIYDDSQNVHNHEINQSMLQTSKNILTSTESGETFVDIHKEFQEICPDYYNQHQTQITESINRIKNDTTKFKDNITMCEVYDKTLSIIFKSKHKEELIKRLAEELVDMNQLCSTGHLSRLINVLQGFENQFKITIDPKDEIYANISTYITNEIQKSADADELLIDMTTPEKKRFLLFLDEIMRLKYIELVKEYRNVIEEIKVKEYIQDAIRNYVDDENLILFSNE
jgi:hypothetical protein